MEPSLLDTDTLSEIMKGFDQHVQDNARRYLAVFRHFTFSLITRYEILRGSQGPSCDPTDSSF